MSDTKDNSTIVATFDAEQGVPMPSGYNEPTAIVVDGTNIKRGHVFFGCCCDVRRAVYVVNRINRILQLGMLFTALRIMGNVADSSTENADTNNNENKESSSKFLLTEIPYVFVVIIAIIGIVFSTIGVIGATKYNTRMVTAVMGYYIASIIVHLIFVDIIGLSIAALFLYPHVVLIREMRAGIMTPQNAEIEDKCCCC